MKKNFTKFAIVAFLLSLSQVVLAQTKVSNAEKDLEKEQKKKQAKALLKESYNKIWIQKNRGQLPNVVQYAFTTSFGAVYIENDKIRLIAEKVIPKSYLEQEGFTRDEQGNRKQKKKESHSVEITFPNSSSHFNVVPGQIQDLKMNYFSGNDQSKWATNVEVYSEVTIEEIYPGVDLRLYSNAAGTLEFDWILTKAMDYDKIRMKFKGQDNVKLTEAGGFSLGLRMGDIDFKVPQSFQVLEGKSHTISARYYTVASDELAFKVFGIVDPNESLVIDPTVLWATFFDNNSSSFDAYSYAVEIDSCGYSYVASTTNISITSSYVNSATGYSTTYVGEGAFFYKMNPLGTAITAFTYLHQNNAFVDLALFPNGRLIAVGYHEEIGTGSGHLNNFPTVNAFYGTGSGGSSGTNTCANCYGLVSVLSGDLSSLIYSSLMPGDEAGLASISLSGDNDDFWGVTSVEVVSNTAYYISGVTDISATNLITGSPVDNTRSGYETYIARFSGTNLNTRDWATYIGGDGDEKFIGIKLDMTKQYLCFAGWIKSNSTTNFPTLQFPIDSTRSGDGEDFIGAISNSASVPTSFYTLSLMGGNGTNTTQSAGSTIDIFGDGLPVIDCDSNYIYMLSYTTSSNWPGTGVSGVYQSANAGTADLTFTRFPIGGRRSSGFTNFRSTYLGGSSGEIAGGLVYNTQDYNLYFFGTTNSTDAPTQNTTPSSNFFDNSKAADLDLYLGTIATNLTSLKYATYLGGSAGGSNADDYLGSTGKLRGTGHYAFNRKADIYAMTTTVHGNPSGTSGSSNELISSSSWDNTKSNVGDDGQILVQMNLSSADLGDVPATYEKGNPARNAFNPRVTTNVVRLGLKIDADLQNQPNAIASGDDDNVTSADPCTSGGDDEDGVSTFPVLNAEDPTLGVTTYSVSVSVFNNTGSAQTLMGWIDFDDSGTFSATERATVSVPSSASQQTVTLSWTITGRVCPVSIVGGRTYARLRIGSTANFPTDVASTWADERAQGSMNDGEVEDYYVNIRARDYGDLPLTGTPSYSTSSILRWGDFNDDNIPDDAGAVWAGTRVDIEKNCSALGNATATADDNNQVDDEDGLVFPGVGMKRATSYNFTINASGTTSGGTAYYGLWFDFNGDGDFTDPKDDFYSGSIALSTGATGPYTGSVTISVATPPGTGQFTRTQFGTRLVIRNTSAPASGNYFANYSTSFNGEVEDYVGDYAIVISGNVFNDQDGTNDNQVDGPAINQPGGAANQLWAYAINGSNVIVDSVMVTSAGTFDLLNVVAGTVYTVRISTTRLAVGSSAASLTASLPAGWYAVSEKYGLNDAVTANNNQIESGYSTANMAISTSLGTISGVTQINFGIDQEPTSNNVSSASQVNPGGTVQVVAPTLSGNDPEEGAMGTGKRFRITGLDANANIYYNGTLLTTSSLPYTFFSYKPSALTVDPIPTGAVTIVFNYVWVDSAGVPDGVPNTITLPFTDPSITISGTVFDDGDGTLDGAIDGTPFNKPSGTQLYAYVVNSSNVVIDSQYVLTNGTYTLTANGSTSNLKVILTTSQYGIGATASTIAVPSNWLNVGESFGTNNSAGSGIEGNTTTANGSVAVNTGTSNITGLNFGLNIRPTSDDKTASAVANPGGTTKVTAPTLTGGDLEDGSGVGKTLPGITNTIRITTLPTNGTLYYNNVAVAANQIIANYNPSLLSVDPSFNGAGTVTFFYVWKDSAQAEDLSTAKVDMPFTDLTLSGTVFDDGDGNFDGAIDGTGIGSPDGTQLYAYLDSAGIVVRKVTLPSNGTYSFANLASTTSYIVRISSTSVALGAATPAASSTPVTNWLSTGEQFGTNNTAGTGIESGTANSSIAVTTGSSNLANVNFGIDKRPTSDDKTASAVANPGGTTKVTAPTLTGGDLEDGSGVGKTLPGITNTIRITTLPTNGTLYYNNVAVAANQIIANYNPSLLSVDPSFNGAGTVTFFYVWKDSAQAEDLSPAKVDMPFTDLTLSGTVFDDGDGNLDGAIDGTGIGSPDGTQLYAYLDSAGIVVRKVTLPSNGTYSFANLASTTSYIVRISSTSVALGAATPAASSTPVTNWLSTGEQFGTNNTAGTGIESGTANSSIAVTTGSSNLANVNFGIDKRPTSDDKTASAVANPGGTTKVTAPTLTGGDLEDGSGVGKTLPGITNTIRITTLPTNGTLYYNNVAVAANQIIANYNPSLLSVDPSFNGAGTVTFFYVWKDSAQAEDLSPAKVDMPFTDLTLSGTVFDDGDGNLDGAIDGTGIGSPDGTQLYAYLDSAGIVVRKVTLPSNGTYSFANIASTTNYTVVISSSNVALGAATPAASSTPVTNWLSTGEQFGTNNTAGTGIESGTANSSIAVTTGSSNLANVNFGIDKRPTSDDKTVTGLTNPGGTTKVTAPTLTGGDLEDGTGGGLTLPGLTNTIVITTLPTTGTLYYNNVAVSVNQVIANYNPSLLSVDPNFNGAGTVTFFYVWKDSAQALDLTPAKVEMTFTDLTISGTVFDDGDGNLDGAVDGTGIGSLDGTQLYAYLDSAGIVVRKVTLPSNGTYSFANIASTTSYNVVISSSNVALGAATPAGSSNPATNWVATGEQFGTNNTAGSGIETGTANGSIAITTASSNINNVNFGLDKRPTSDKKTASAQLNPGGTVQVTVPTLTGGDLEDGAGVGKTLPGITNTIIISTLPSNATLYYNGNAVSAGQVIGNYNPSLLTIDPTFNGAGTTIFTYAWRDSAHLADLTPDSVIMPFTAITISGTVFHDANGVVDVTVNGTPIGDPATNQLYAYLVNNGLIQEKTPVNTTNGTFSFNTGDANTNYNVRISTANLTVGAAAPGSTTLPTSWVNVGEDFGTNNSAGSGLTSGNPDGVLSVTTSTLDVSGIKFGIEVLSAAHDKTFLVNPDSITGLTGMGWGNFTHFIKLNAANGTSDAVINSNNTAIKPGKISGLDPEDGKYDGATGATPGKIALTSLPDTNDAALVYFNGTSNIILYPNPPVGSPSYGYWNQTTSRYEISNLVAGNLIFFLKMNYQSSSSFQYAYMDAAGLFGTPATYTLSFTVPLPVSVSDLNCTRVNSGVTLNWTGYDLAEADHFEVVRAGADMQFAKIATIAISNADRSQPKVEYSYTDKTPGEGRSYYRVVLVTKDGSRLQTNACDKTIILQQSGVTVNLAPNPASAYTNVTVTAFEPQVLSIEILDVLGKTIQLTKVDMPGKISLIPLNTEALAPGVYNVRVSWSTGSQVIKFIKE